MAAEEQHSRDSSLIPSLSSPEEGGLVPMYDKLCQQNWPSSSGSSDFGYSSLGSTLDSELGSTESQSDQDDEYMAELTRQMAHYMLQDDDDPKHQKEQATPWTDCQEQVLVMGSLSKLEIDEETEECKSSSRFENTTLETASANSTAWNPSSHGIDFQSKQALIDEQIRAAQLNLHEKRQKQQASVCGGKEAKQNNRPARKRRIKQVHDKGTASCGGSGPEIPASNLQEPQKKGPEAAPAALFVETASRTESRGTGVFLPRATCNNNTTESRNKPGCSTVIIPARVAQALKLHFDGMGPPSRSNGTGVLFQQDPSNGDVCFVLQPQPKNRSRKASASASKHHRDIGLPKEWTY